MTFALDDLPAVVFAGVTDDYLLPGDARDGGDQFLAVEDADGVLAQVGGDDLAGIATSPVQVPRRARPGGHSFKFRAGSQPARVAGQRTAP